MIFSAFLENIFFLLIVKFKILGEVNIQYSIKGGSSLDLFQFNSVFLLLRICICPILGAVKMNKFNL